jgi:hypothetical protein
MRSPRKNLGHGFVGSSEPLIFRVEEFQSFGLRDFKEEELDEFSNFVSGEIPT